MQLNIFHPKMNKFPGLLHLTYKLDKLTNMNSVHLLSLVIPRNKDLHLGKHKETSMFGPHREV